MLPAPDTTTLAITTATSDVTVSAVFPIARAQQIPRVAFGPGTTLLFNTIDESTATVRVTDELDALVLALYAQDPSTGATTLVDKDAMIQDSDPGSGLVLVRSQLEDARLRVFDLNSWQEVGVLPVGRLAAGCLLRDGSVLAFDGGAVVHWTFADGGVETLAKFSDIGLTTDVDKTLCQGPEVAALDHAGTLVIFDPTTLSSRVVSTTADPRADPAMTWVGTSLYWVDADYVAHSYAVSGYDLSLGRHTTESLSGAGFGILATGVSAWDRSSLLLVRGMLGTGYPLSEIVLDRPADSSVEDQVPLNVSRDPAAAFQHAYVDPATGRVLVVLDDPSASTATLWLMEAR